ncbi:MAG TPA: (Fe-S)-binding protein [Xanthomonadaceae bacterium]|nr:(Fe-S)-binding protein [Xanthomonadaceae bacterium]
MLCGLCLPHCPTYALDRQESESPRGRITLIQALAEQRVSASDVDLQHLEHCLDCRRCEAACPAKVDYGALLAGGRELLRRRGAPTQQLDQRLIGSLLARPRLLHRLLGLARVVWRWLPRRLSGTMPRPPASARLQQPCNDPSAKKQQGEVALFLGCVARRCGNSALQAAIDLLSRLGWSVVIPDAQTCCGAQAIHAGEAPRANALATSNQLAFTGIARTVTLDSGCHEALSNSLTGETLDVLDLLDQDDAFHRLPWHNTPIRVAVFAPCTQRHVVRSDAALRRLLARLPGVEAIWLDIGCCGAAGDHMLRFPERAATLREPLLQQLIDSGCDQLLVANIGCRLHLQAGAEAHGLDTRVVHPVEFITQRLLPDMPEDSP